MEAQNTSREPALPDCQELFELLPAYSLGVSTPEEDRRVQVLLHLCPEAVPTLTDYQVIGDHLMTLFPMTETPPSSEALLKRIRASTAPARAHRPAVSPSPVVNPARPRPPSARPQKTTPPLAARRPWGWLALTACFLVAFVGMNIYWAAQIEALRRDQQVLLQTLAARPADTPLALNATNHHRILLPSAETGGASQASFVWNSAEQVGALVVEGLPSLAPNEIYQLWLVRADEALSLGTFTVDAAGTGILIFQSTQPIADFEHIGVNIEPVGGTDEPTTPHIIIGNI